MYFGYNKLSAAYINILEKHKCFCVLEYQLQFSLAENTSNLIVNNWKVFLSTKFLFQEKVWFTQWLRWVRTTMNPYPHQTTQNHQTLSLFQGSITFLKIKVVMHIFLTNKKHNILVIWLLTVYLLWQMF